MIITPSEVVVDQTDGLRSMQSLTIAVKVVVVVANFPLLFNRVEILTLRSI